MNTSSQLRISTAADRGQSDFVASTPLWTFGDIRKSVIEDVVGVTSLELLKNSDPSALELLLSEALYSERLRLKRNRPNWFTKARNQSDIELWNSVQAGLLSGPAQMDRKAVLHQVLEHYLEEIAGKFNPRVYRFATHAIPWGFSWLLNAASTRTLLPWKGKEEVHSRLRIGGEVPMLQRLAEKGTVLLVPTHQSNVDSLMIGYIIHLMRLPPFAYGAGLNLFSNPLLSYFMRRLGSYTVDRQKSNPIYKASLKHYSTQILKRGVHSIFFPGGGRSRSGALESKLKLGLLGTGLQAQIENLKEGRPRPNVYVVPMVTSYNFVLEASSLIEDYLLEAGKHRYMMSSDEGWGGARVAGFFWKLFATQSTVDVRIGKAMDVFGNFVDEDGRSIGPNGTVIEPKKWLTTLGEIGAESDRDQEYTRMLGQRISERYHRENTVLTSQLVAFTLFETLRRQYPHLDLYRFLRLSRAQRTLTLDDFLTEAEYFHREVIRQAERGQLFLSRELRTTDTLEWVRHGVNNLGIFHENKAVALGDASVSSEDMNLLYYYRNRLTGYGLQKLKGSHEGKGFLE